MRQKLLLATLQTAYLVSCQSVFNAISDSFYYLIRLNERLILMHTILKTLALIWCIIHSFRVDTFRDMGEVVTKLKHNGDNQPLYRLLVDILNDLLLQMMSFSPSRGNPARYNPTF